MANLIPRNRIIVTQPALCSIRSVLLLSTFIELPITLRGHFRDVGNPFYLQITELTGAGTTRKVMDFIKNPSFTKKGRVLSLLSLPYTQHTLHLLSTLIIF